MDTVKFRFSDKTARGMLSSHCGEGWEASLIKAEEVRRTYGAGLSCVLMPCDYHVTSCHPICPLGVQQ